MRPFVLITLTALSCSPAPPAQRATLPAPPPPVAQTPPASPPPPPPAAPPALDLSLSRMRKTTPYHADRAIAADERARRAIETKTAVVEGLFRAVELPFPPAELLFRAWKQERELEVWASSSRGAAMKLVATYEICTLSGGLGPKRREGDYQVPEGFYKIQYLWPNSAYHLEMKVGYPNDLDRALSKEIPEGPGGEIMIHGSCASIGCLAMGDERIEELWTMASAFQTGDRRVHVHIYPARDIPALVREPAHAPHHRFWENLGEGLQRFEGDHRLFDTWADWHARYYFR